MASRTIRVSGISDELLHRLDEKVRQQHAASRAAYIRELICRDVRGPEMPTRTLRELLAPVHAETRERAYTEGDVEPFAEEALLAYRREQ